MAAQKRQTPDATPIPVRTPDPSEPSREEAIRRRAYELYEKRGMLDGHADEDWLEAEREIQGDEENPAA